MPLVAQLRNELKAEHLAAVPLGKLMRDAGKPA
jgi:hypothetical protein